MYVNKEEQKEKLGNTDIKLAYNERFAIGKIIGKIEGKIEDKIERTLASKKEIIKNLTDMKMSSEQIAIAVNLPIKEVEKIPKRAKKELKTCSNSFPKVKVQQKSPEIKQNLSKIKKTSSNTPCKYAIMLQRRD